MRSTLFLVLALVLLGCAPQHIKEEQPPTVTISYHKGMIPIGCDVGDISLCVRSEGFTSVKVEPMKQEPLSMLGTAIYKIDQKGVNIQSHGWVKYKLHADGEGGAWIILGKDSWIALTYNGTIYWMATTGTDPIMAIN